jgi:UDP-N-acetylenolpyruvoylglucosamine reductase
VPFELYPIAEWQTYLAVQAGAAATLTGLVSVAVSLNLSKIMAVASLPGRAGESIVQFLGAFFLSSVALIPRQHVTMLAAEILTISVSSWAIQGAGRSAMQSRV